MKRKVCLCLLTACMMTVLWGCGDEVASGQQESSGEVIEQEQESTVVSESTTESEPEETTQETEVAQDTEESQETAESQETEGSQETEVIQESEEEEMGTQEDNNFEVPSNYASLQKGALYSKIEEITYDSQTTGTTRKANIILPFNYSEEKEYPVLYLLHGIGGDHNEWRSGEPVKIVANLVAAGETSEMIVVIPNVRARANDVGNPRDIYSLEHYQAFDNFINDLRDDLMPFIEANYSVATGKENTAIAGLSMGGRESLYIGFSMPETFGYIGAFTPAPGILPYTNFGVTEDGLFTEDTFTLPEGSDNFVMIVAGKSDGVVGEWPANYHKTLEQNGVEHIFYETAGGHDFTVWKHGLYNFVKRIF